jgi:hypothetical protein
VASSEDPYAQFIYEEVLIHVMLRMKPKADILNICCCSKNPGYVK